MARPGQKEKEKLFRGTGKREPGSSFDWCFRLPDYINVLGNHSSYLKPNSHVYRIVVEQSYLQVCRKFRHNICLLLVWCFAHSIVLVKRYGSPVLIDRSVTQSSGIQWSRCFVLLLTRKLKMTVESASLDRAVKDSEH